MTATIQIDKGIPMPEKRHSMSTIFKNMAVGDSFVVGQRRDQSLRAAANRAGIRISIREDATGVRRCWRTA